MVDSLLLVRSDIRPSLVSFLSCLDEMTVADFLVLLSALPTEISMFALLLVELGNSSWFHTYVAFSLFMLGHTIVCT